MPTRRPARRGRSFAAPVAALFAVLAPVALLPLAAPARAADVPPDVALATTESIMARAFGPQRDSAPLLATLFLSHDAGLTPLFAAAAQHAPGATTRLNAMVGDAMLAKDPSRIDVKAMLAASPQDGSGALAQLIDTKLITDDQLHQVIADSTEPVQRVMAAAELDKRHALKDRAILSKLAADPDHVVRYYAAVSLLASSDSAEQALGLKTLTDLTAQPDLRASPVRRLMVMRIRKDKIAAAAPWVESLARDKGLSPTERVTAVAALLALHKADAPALLAQALHDADRVITTIQLGMVAVEFADQLSPPTLDPLVNSKTTLVHELGQTAQARLDGEPGIPALKRLIDLRQPIIQNWALGFADSAGPDVALAIRQTLASQAEVVDEQRDNDFARAALAAQAIAETDTPAARNVLASLLQSENRGVVEAALLGLFHSKRANASELVLPVWPVVSTRPHYEQAANSAALILAREGHKEALTWLPKMITGATVENDGYRALAGWYYAKLTGQADALLKRVLAAAPASQP